MFSRFSFRVRPFLRRLLFPRLFLLSFISCSPFTRPLEPREPFVFFFLFLRCSRGRIPFVHFLALPGVRVCACSCIVPSPFPVPRVNANADLRHPRSGINAKRGDGCRVRTYAISSPSRPFPFHLFFPFHILSSFTFPRSRSRSRSHSRSLVSPPCLLHDSSFVVVRMCVWGTLMGSSPAFQNECGIDHDRGNAG